MINAGLSLQPDSLIFDLEDAVHPDEKDAARSLLQQALPLFSEQNVAVRINCSEGCWREDLELVKNHDVKMIVVPKAQADFLEEIHILLDSWNCSTKIAALIESASSLENLEKIILSTPRVFALLLGAEDYCLDMGIERSVSGEEILYARSRVCNKAHAFGLEALDTPFVGIADNEALQQDAALAKRLGFTGKLSINPHQIHIIQQTFRPTEEEITWAKRVIELVSDPANKAKGAISLDNKMIDLPIIKRAEKTLALHAAQGGNI